MCRAGPLRAGAGCAPDCEVSPNATIEPVPSRCGAGARGGPVPTDAYSARPVALTPPKEAPPSGSFARIIPLAGSRAVTKPLGSTL